MGRTLTIYWDVKDNVFRDSGGVQLRSADFPFINFKENPLINLQLVTDSLLTELTDLNDLVSTAEFRVAVDDDFDDSSTVLCRATHSMFNKTGEWEVESTGTADEALGQFSFYLNANTTELDDALGSNARINNSKMELIIEDTPGGVVCAVYRFPFRCRNLIDPTGTSPTTIADTYAKGTISIPNGVNSVSVTGLGLSVPVDVALVSVGKPSALDSNIFGTVVEDSKDTDGFDVEFSANMPAAGYILNYLAWT